MELETQPPTFFQWLPDALAGWLLLMAVLAGLGVIVAAVRMVSAYGGRRAGMRLVQAIASAAADLWTTSPRRVWALARLGVQESLRRRVLAGIAVFALVLLFALWFLDTSSIDPQALYTSFVLSAATYLLLAMVLFLSVFSLPADIKSKTIYTIVTKPVRAGELVLGRMAGFVIVGTGLLAVMGFSSYLFIVRTLDHTHTLLASGESPSQESGAGRILIGTTSTDEGHHHHLLLSADGQLSTDVSRGHWHPAHAEEQSGKTNYQIGGPRGQFHARVPIYGSLRFKDRAGSDARSGVNVGNEWTYRSYVEGGTLAAAIWRFEGVDPARFPAGLPIDLTIRVFRTHKGNIEQGVLGSFVLRNPRTKLTSAPQDFAAKEFTTDRHLVPRALADSSGRSIDLFKDLVADGAIEIQLSCLQRGQFFGMAQADLYLLAREASVPLNFLKGYAGIWLQMVLIAAFGVMWSTFLNGPVAMLATLATLVAGFFSPFIRSLAEGQVAGGGTFESLVRIVQNKTTAAHLDEGWGTAVVHGLDTGVRWLMRVASRLLPDLSSFSDVNYVAAGFDIPAQRLAIQAVSALGYVIPIFFFAFLFFRSREVARS